MVLLNVGKTYDISSLSLRFKGLQAVNWGEADRSKTLTFSKRNLIFNSTVNLITIPKPAEADSESSSDFTLQAGQHAFPFEFTLPVNIPPSMRFNQSKTTYSVMAKCRRADGKTCSIKAPINVVIEPASVRLESDIVQYLQPDQLDAPQYPDTAVVQDLEAKVSGRVYHPGSEAVINIRMKNTTQSPLESLKLSLVQTVVLKSDYRSRIWKNYFINQELKGALNFPIPPGEERSFSVTAFIPDDPSLLPTVTRDISPLMCATYHFKIWCTALGSNDPWNSALKTKIPIRMGYKSRPELAGVARPLSPMGTPGELRTMDQITLAPTITSTFPVNALGERPLNRGKLEWVFMDIQGALSPALKSNQQFKPGKLAKKSKPKTKKGKDEFWSEWKDNQSVNLFPGIPSKGETWSSPTGGVNFESEGSRPLPTTYDENVFVQPLEEGFFSAPPPEEMITDLPMPESIPPPPPPPPPKADVSNYFEQKAPYVEQKAPYQPWTEPSQAWGEQKEQFGS